MAVWLPILKASLPYVTQIVATAIPAFTSKPAIARPDDEVQKQIAELQAAVTKNAESVQSLAMQLKVALEGIDTGAIELQKEMQKLRRMAAGAIIIAAVSSVVTILAVLK
jgi:hypothetical protein